MDIDAFMECVRQGTIPPSSPDGLDEHGWAHPEWYYHGTEHLRDRNECNERGMWAIVSRDLARAMAEYISGRQVLEIMAGAGWLARALADEGVSIIATDNGEWDSRHEKMRRLFPIEQLEASGAVRQHPETELLLVSWPPYAESAIVPACESWGTERPIIYIGETAGGCNAPDEWWDHFWEDRETQIPLASWPGLHDHVFVGHWSNGHNAHEHLP